MDRGAAAARVRPLHAGDRHALADAFERMSAESRRRRFLATKPRLTERELAYLTDIDHVSHEALAALDADGRIVAVARYVADMSRPGAAEVAVEVVDDHQGRGLGSMLVRRVVERARENGFARLTASMLWENVAARSLFKRLGFCVRGAAQGLIELELELAAGGGAADAEVAVAAAPAA